MLGQRPDLAWQVSSLGIGSEQLQGCRRLVQNQRFQLTGIQQRLASALNQDGIAEPAPGGGHGQRTAVEKLPSASTTANTRTELRFRRSDMSIPSFFDIFILSITCRC